MAPSRTDDPGEATRIRQAADGDPQAWAALLEAHRARLRRMVALRLDRRLQGRIDPSDVIQEAYLDATAGLPEYAARAEMPFFLWLRWLTGMRLNAAHRKHLGCQVRDAAREVSIDRGPWPQATSVALAALLLGRLTSPTRAAQRAEMKVQLQEALNGMDPIDREVLTLRHFEELSNAETAEVHRIGRTAACNRYLRALKRLRDILTEIPGFLDP